MSKHGNQPELFEIENSTLFKRADGASSGAGYASRGKAPRYAAKKAAPKKSAFGGGLAFSQPAQPHGAFANPGFGGGFGNNTDVVQSSVSQLDVNKLADKLMDALVVTPFIACLGVLVEKGADTHQQVKKLEKFRDLEAEKKMLAIANGLETQQIDSGNQGEERVVKRDEVLRRRQIEGSKAKN